ncbi:unnamed protein product [Caenorhabditis brenneri]
MSSNHTSSINGFAWETLAPPTLIVLLVLSVFGLLFTKLEKSVIPEIRNIQYFNFCISGVYALLIMGRNVFKLYELNEVENLVTDSIQSIWMWSCLFETTTTFAWIINLLFFVYHHEVYELVVSIVISLSAATFALSPVLVFRLHTWFQQDPYKPHFTTANVICISFSGLIGVCCLIFSIFYTIPEHKIMKRGDDVDMRVYYYHLHSKSFYIAGLSYGYQGENRLENQAIQHNNENRDNGPEIEMEMGYFERQQRWAMNHQRFDGNGSPPLNFPPRA